jgi:hypothetical protein
MADKPKRKMSAVMVIPKALGGGSENALGFAVALKLDEGSSAQPELF